MIILLFLLGAGLRFFCLGDKPLWLDEACSLYQAQRPLPILIREAFSYDLHPPLYSILLHYWIKLGDGEFVVRALSAIFGFLSLIAFYKLTHLAMDKKESLIALCLFTFSTLINFFNQEARPYSMFLFESILLHYIFLKRLSSENKAYTLLYTLIGITSIYTHIYAFLIFLSHMFYLLVFKRNERKKACEIFFSLLTIILFFLPWLPAVLSKRYLFKGEWKREVFLPGLREVLTEFNFCLDIFPSLITSILVSVFVLIAFFTIIRYKDIRMKAYVLVSFTLPLFVVLLYPFRVHHFNVREVIFIAPLWYMALAYGIGRLKRFYKVSLLVLWLFGNLVTSSIYYSHSFIKENWRDAARFVKENEREGEVIIFNPSYLGFPFDYYYRGILLRGKIETGEEVRALRERYSSLWLIESSSDVSPPLKKTRILIEELFKKKGSFIWEGYLGDIVVTKFH